MNYEIHLTLNVSDIESFKQDCVRIGIKPIIIETENNDKFEIQIMTSSKHSGNNYQFVLNELLSKLNNYEVLRKKIEIQPEETKHANHVYYETHLRLKLPKDFDRTPIKNLCKEFNFHFSKNLFKKSDDFVWQMITYRDYNSDLVSFNEVIVNISKKLKELNIYCDKIEIEECIFDSNEKIDDTWLK